VRNSFLFFLFFSLFTIACEQPAANSDKAEELVQRLPFLGPHEVNGTDTIFYEIPKFSFVNQNGLEISHHQYFGKIYVADFFFSTCPTICPVMSSQMARLQAMIKNEALQDSIMLISHSVDPIHDTPEVLLAYSQKIGADLSNWNFVTGDTSDIYYQGKQGYLISALPDSKAPGGFLHSDQFILIDQNRHIRGYYDGTSTAEVDKLLSHIKFLSHEQ